MTLVDPFASIFADEAQTAPVEAPDNPVSADAVAVKKAVGTVSVDVKPVIQSAELSSKVTLTFKGGSAYDAPWIVVHANDLDDALKQVTLDNAVTLSTLMTQVQKAGAHFVSQAPTKAPSNNINVAAPAAQSPSSPPHGAVSAPGGESRQCRHGEMTFRSGVSAKNGKVWKAFMCPTPQGTADQCEAEWLR